MNNTFLRSLLACLLALIMLLSTACGGTQQADGSDSASADSQTQNQETSGSADVSSEEDSTASNPTPTGLPLAVNGTSSYRIVYPEGANSEIMGGVLELQEAFSELFGIALQSGDDFLKNNETEDTAAYEILIGSTNRAATKTVADTLELSDYTACAVGNKLVLLGSDDRGTLAAVSELISRMEAISATDFYFSEEDSFLLQTPKRTTVSFFGDSITTYIGYSNNASINSTLSQNATWYTQVRMPVTSTWWYGTVTEMDWDLCVNNSYSGGRVTNPLTTETRSFNLHTDAGVKPDVIIIYFGINDYNNMVSLSEFSTAYDTMLKNMRTTYPNAKIYCCTLIPIICTDNGRNTDLEQNGAGVSITAFNNAILRLADANGADFIDFHGQIGTTLYQYTYDNIHPNADGMKLMRDVVVQKLKADFS